MLIKYTCSAVIYSAIGIFQEILITSSLLTFETTLDSADTTIYNGDIAR
jgi:hypothetical protein